MQDDATSAAADERTALHTDFTELLRQLGPNADLVTRPITDVVVAAVLGEAPSRLRTRQRARLLDDFTALVRELDRYAYLVTDRIRDAVLAAVSGAEGPDPDGADVRRVMFADYCDVQDRHDGLAAEWLDWRQYGTNPDAVLDVTEQDVDWHRGALLAAAPVRAAHAA